MSFVAPQLLQVNQEMLEGLKNFWFKELPSLPQSAEATGVWPFTGNPRAWIDPTDPNYTPSIYADRPGIDVTGSGVINSVGKSGLKPILRQLKSDIKIPLDEKSMTKILKPDRSDFLRNQGLLPPKSGEKLYHGKVKGTKLKGGKPIFLTPHKKGAEWYSYKTGLKGEVLEFQASMKNPASHKDLMQAVEDTGVAVKDIGIHSPYGGSNPNDYLYVPKVIKNLKEKGFDSFKGYDILENSEIPVRVVFDKSQLKSTPKIGDMVKLPGGKARFDGVWEASGSYPERYQYTYHEGPARGDTFISASHNIADVSAAGIKKLEMRGAVNLPFEKFKIVKGEDKALYKGKPTWSGSVNLIDGYIEEVHPYSLAEANDFHHSMYFSQPRIEKFRTGEESFFFINQKGEIQGHPDPLSNKIKKKIYQQLEPNVPINSKSSNLKKDLDALINEADNLIK